MLLHEAGADAETIVSAIRALPAVQRAEAAGALRRRTETVAQLDVVIAGGDASAILDRVARLPQVASTVERAADRLTLRLTSGMSLRVTVIPPALCAVILHRLTGSEGHLARLEARAREIEAAAAGVMPERPLQIADIRGMDGSLDYPDAILEQLDVVIASVHHRHRMDAAQMTAASPRPCDTRASRSGGTRWAATSCGARHSPATWRRSWTRWPNRARPSRSTAIPIVSTWSPAGSCLLYTSDAADE